MLSQSDRDAIKLETRRGIFSLEYDEGFEKFLYFLDKSFKRGGIESDYIPARLKAVVAHVRKAINKKRKGVNVNKSS